MTIGEVCINLTAKKTYTPKDYSWFFSGLGYPSMFGYKYNNGKDDSDWQKSFKDDSFKFHLSEENECGSIHVETMLIHIDEKY